MTRYCAGCGDSFDPKFAAHKLCWRCWRDRRDMRLQDAAYGAGYDAGYQDGASSTARSSHHPPVNAVLLPDLVQLCHPDRHPPERAAVANRTTAVLLDMLGHGRRAA